MSAEHPVRWFFAIQPLWMGCFGGMLVFQHVRLVMKNLTTNEAINFSKYEYLRDPSSGRFRNPYNYGAKHNVLEFLGSGLVWSAVWDVG